MSSDNKINITGDDNIVGDENVSQTIKADRGSSISDVTQISSKGDVHIGDKIYTRSQTEELHDYLKQAVAAYEARMYQLVARPAAPPDQPYKFLYAFEIEDADIFFGRDTSCEEFYQTILKDRLTILHAKSGAGKTSLLNAGLSPCLIREGRLPVYARAYEDPVRAIKRAIAFPSLGQWPERLPKLSLQEFLGITCQHLSRRTQELVIILDQFEEFFIFWPERDHRQPFIDALADSYADKSLPVRFIIALRKDYYSDLADFQERILTILYNEYRLDTMTRGEAQAAVTEPVAKLNRAVSYEQDLLDRLLDDLTRGGMELPHLQIICTQLYEALAKNKKTITLTTYKKLGKAEGILGGYLNNVLNKLPGKGEAIAKEVLKELVSSEATKRVINYNKLVARIEAEKEELDSILARLVNARLLRRDEVIGGITYEMAHEYLIEEIQKWVDQTDLEFKQAEELLMREVENWRTHGTLIPKDRLELLHGHRERFRDWDEEMSECILRSSLEADFAVEDWIQVTNKFREKVLFDTLNNPNKEIRKRVVKMLEYFGFPEAVEPLINSLQDEDSGVRLITVFALFKIGDFRAVKPLCKILQDEEEFVRSVVAMILGKFGDPQSIKPLISALQDKSWVVRRNAIQSLGAIWGLPTVFRGEVEDNIVSLKAANTLGRINDPLAAIPLINTLRNKENSVTYPLDQEHEKIDKHQIVETIIIALQDKDWHIRWEAAKILVKVGDSRVIEPLILVLREEHSEIRQAAVKELGKSKNYQVVKPLISALYDENEGVREAATQALGEIGEHAVEPLIAILHNKDSEVSQKATRALVKIGENAVEPLIAVLQGNGSDLGRKAATWALGKIGDRRAVEPLIIALKDKSCNVRGAAAKALGKIGDHCAVKQLIAVLQDEISGIQGAAATALGDIGAHQAVESLIAALNSNNEGVRRTTVEALGRIRDLRAVKPLVATLQDENISVHRTAAEALKKIGTPEALAALKEYEQKNRQK